MNRAPSPAPLRVLLLGASFSSQNRGVSALAGGALASIYHAHPDAEVSFLDYAKQPAGHEFILGGRSRRIPTVPLRFSKNPFLPNHVARLAATAAWLRLLPAERRAAAQRANPVFRAILGADLVCALCGGDSFSSLYGLRRLLYVTLPQSLVLLLGRPLVLLPQSYGPFTHPPARWIARRILRGAQRIYTRDADGAEALRRLAPAAADRIAFAYDLGFALEPHPAPENLRRAMAALPGDGPLVGLNVSGLLANSRHAKRRFHLRDDYAAAMRELVTALVLHRGCRVVLIPHVYGLGGESDLTAALNLRQGLRPEVAAHVLLWPDSIDQHEVKDCIGRCDFFVGARMHACIAALSQHVPTLALAYSHKFSGVLDSLRVGELVFDLRLGDRHDLIAAVRTACDERARLADRLASRMPAVRAQVLGFFGELTARARPAATAAAV